jgi:hypothetical protein
MEIRKSMVYTALKVRSVNLVKGRVRRQASQKPSMNENNQYSPPIIAATTASMIPACCEADEVEAPFEGLDPGAVEVELPLDIALALKAAKLFGPDSTALTENTMPAVQWEPCRQYAQIGAD